MHIILAILGAVALRYRTQAPLIDALMKELGINGGDLEGLAGGLAETDDAKE